MKKAKDFTGFPGDCNEEQLLALQQFRLQATALGCTDPPYDDPTLLRFLRARKFNIPKTQEMFTIHVEWVKYNDVENINKYIFKELPHVRQYYPHGYHKTDKMGRPIYIERVGKLQITQLFEVTTDQRMIRYYIQSYETLLNRIFPECSKAKGSRVDQTMTILDLNGCSMGMASKQVYNFIQLASRVGQDHYPEILGKMFIVNAPFLFTGVWACIKIWLDEKTKSKITIIGGSYKEELLKFIDIENLPDFLGGTSKCAEGQDILAMNIGPWNPDGLHPLFPCEPNYQDKQLEDQFSGLNITGTSGQVTLNQDIKLVQTHEAIDDTPQQQQQQTTSADHQSDAQK